MLPGKQPFYSMESRLGILLAEANPNLRANSTLRRWFFESKGVEQSWEDDKAVVAYVLWCDPHPDLLWVERFLSIVSAFGR